MDLVAKSDILNKPITPEEAADPEALEAKRQEMLATAQKFAKTAAAMLEERTIAANFVDHFQKKDREVDESLEKVRQLEKHWEAKVKFVQEEEARIRREAILPRKITFATPTEQPLATPKDNMKKAAELLKKKDEEIDINYVRKLVASAMQQQSKADTSRSSERSGKGKGRCTLAETNTVFHHHHPELRVLRYPLDVAVLPETPGPMGQGNQHPRRDASSRDRNERTLEQLEAEPRPRAEPRRSQERDLSLAEAKDATRNPGGAERGVRTEPRRSRNDGGDHHQEERSHRSRSQPREPRRESEGGRTSYRPLADLPHRHPVEAEAEAEAEAEIPFPLKSPGGAPRDARDRLNEYRSDYIGPRCFGQMIREEPKPRSLNLKLPGNLKHYDGSERPDTWIEDYYNAVTFAGGTPNIACRMLQLYLIGPARVWLSDLEENTIFCWLDLKKAFENHFRGTYKRPATTSDLQACIQKKGETSRSFLTRWLATRNE
ncbi:hypothetical protein QYE76_019978 [Lolium multiflorum]|uniref:Retrotransposon gag domain-containing protein n=1 Tax=Lolium multiflorum TaxID=4521 RepID=A0AAD8R4Z9_LOLMU|nr:hypothetical protein QYE76_019978 [Lolium multiflorum]